MSGASRCDAFVRMLQLLSLIDNTEEFREVGGTCETKIHGTTCPPGSEPVEDAFSAILRDLQQIHLVTLQK